MKNTFITAAMCLASLGSFAQAPFAPLDTNFASTKVVIPASPLKYDALFVGNTDYVYINGLDSALAKQNHDFIGYVPSGHNSNRGWMIVNHETTTKNPKLGDGGGQTSFEVRWNTSAKKWEVLPSIAGKKFHNVDFTSVGGTLNNCGGAQTLYGTTLTAEEYPPANNLALSSAVSDTSDFTIPAGNGPYSGKTIKKYQNYGWMVEANPKTAKGIRKYYSMGRYAHEGGYVMSDGKTVYLTDDNTPGLFFKFVAKKANDYRTGQLYAYKQGANGVGGSWIALPSQLDSLLNIRDIALKKGATSFTRLEWVELAGNGKMYITETGNDNANHTAAIALGGNLAYHNQILDTLGGQTKDYKYADYYGRVLEFDLTTNTIRPYINGGNGSSLKTNFSNPDGLASTTIDGHHYLVMNEDLNGASQNRMPVGPNNGKNICEVYFIELDKTNPTVNDLHRFIIGPVGAETTGGRFTPNGGTYFVNIQHPSASNTPPFNNSTTIAVTGFVQYIRENNLFNESLEAAKTGDIQNTEGASFSIYPNPAARELHFNKTTDIAIYDASGMVVKVERNTNITDISGLLPGVYFVQTISGEVQKLVIE